MSTTFDVPVPALSPAPASTTSTKRSPVLAIVGFGLAVAIAAFAIFQTVSLSSTSGELASTKSTLASTRSTLGVTEAKLSTTQSELDSANAQVSTCSGAVDLYRTLAYKEGKAILKVWGYSNRWSFVISPLIQTSFMGLDAGDIKDARLAGEACQSGGNSLV